MRVFKIVAIIIFVVAIIAGNILGISEFIHGKTLAAFSYLFGLYLGAIFFLSFCMVFVFISENVYAIRRDIQMIREKTCETNNKSDDIYSILSRCK